MMSIGISFIIGLILGCILTYSYDYYHNMKEFQKRQEKYKKMI